VRREPGEGLAPLVLPHPSRRPDARFPPFRSDMDRNGFQWAESATRRFPQDAMETAPHPVLLTARRKAREQLHCRGSTEACPTLLAIAFALWFVWLATYISNPSLSLDKSLAICLAHDACWRTSGHQQPRRRFPQQSCHYLYVERPKQTKAAVQGK